MGKTVSFLLSALFAGCLLEKSNPVSLDPDPEPGSAPDTIRVSLPEPVVPTPQEARSELADRGVLYSQASFIEHAAAGDLEVVRLFIQAGLDVDVQPYTARSTLVSTRVSPTSVSQMKVSFYPEEGEQDNDTALMKAAGNGHLEVVKLIVDSGADLLLRNQQKQTAAMFAAAGGHLEVLKYIGFSKRNHSQTGVGRWPPPVYYKYTDRIPETPMLWAALNGHLDIVRFLWEDYNVTVYPWYGMGWAALGGHQEVASFFLEKMRGWGDNRTNRNHIKYATGISLILASHAGDEEVVRWLLEEGADLHYREKDWIELTTPDGTMYFQEVGNSSLHIAISQGHTGVLRILLEHWMNTQGADGRDPHGLTALMLAAAGGDEGMATTLLDNGTPVNAQTDAGTTALMYAAARGQASLIRLLLARGADASLENAHGNTALSLAQQFGHDEAVAILEGI